jgi:hypothetical protein
MNCTNCGQPTSETDVFCGTCGADLAAQRAAATQEQPTAVLPPQPYHEQPTAVLPMAPPPPPPAAAAPPAPAAATPPPPPGVAAPPAAAPAPAPKRKNTTLIVVGIVVGLILLCTVGSAVFAVLQFGLFGKTIVTEITPPTPESTPAEKPAASAPAATPEAAMKAVLPAGWIMRKINSNAEQAEFWAGPPNSEFTTVYLVTAKDGGWVMGKSYPLEQGGDVAPEDEAVAVVEAFLGFIQQDQPEKAQALTVDPFHSDSASAQYSNGDFLSFEITKVEPAGDGSFFVSTTEKWKNGTDSWTYRLKPTDNGMRISELMIAK